MKAELQTAYLWTCDNCGRDNFIRSIKCDEQVLDEQERQELRDEHGIQPFDIGEWVMQPDEVTCEFCKSTYETR